jgi:glucans biosynthesis protein C
VKPSPLAPIHPNGAVRLAWIDQLRTLIIVLVINMHACVTYSHLGSWYVNEPPEPSGPAKLVFLFWQGHLQSFFMGTLFLIAGYFAQGSLERRGPWGFVRERLVRLGMPTLLYMLALHPLIVFALIPNGGDHGSQAGAYWTYLAKGRFLEGSGPMWFAAALLLFSCALAGWRAVRPAPTIERPPIGRAPRPALVGAWVLLLIAATFLVRTVQPLGTAVLNMQLCYFPQYILAFVAGVAAARGAWLQPLAHSSLARRAGWTGLILGPLALAAVLVAGGAFKGEGYANFTGGWHFAALGIAAWEQLAGVGLGLGALAFCAGNLDVSTPLARWLSERSFGVYVFHPVVLVALAIALRPVAADPFFKVSLLTAAGLAGSYLVADTARRMPGLRAIL